MHASVRRPLLALALFALPALAVAGCGGDDKTAGTTTVSALTADEWRAQTDAVCADIQTRQDAVPEPAGPGDVQSYLETILPLGKEQVSRIKALVPPAELQSIQSQAVANQEAAVAIVEKAIDRIKGGEDESKVVLELTAEVNKITAEGNRLADEAGLTKCGSEGDSTSTTTDATTDATTESTETTTTAESPTIPTTGNAQVDKFLADVQKATTALTAFGNALTSVSNPDEIKAKTTELRGQLGDFDAAIAAMDGYTLDNATVEGQRSRLVASGPKVSDVLREFIDAGATGDLAKIGAVLPKVATALQEFTVAAQPK
jgi:hypothetical protein